jgi:hypothetical protein
MLEDLDGAAPSRRAAIHDSRTRLRHWAAALIVAALVSLTAFAMVSLATAFASTSVFVGGLGSVNVVGRAVVANGDRSAHGAVTGPRSVGMLLRRELLISDFARARQG